MGAFVGEDCLSLFLSAENNNNNNNNDSSDNNNKSRAGASSSWTDRQLRDVVVMSVLMAGRDAATAAALLFRAGRGHDVPGRHREAPRGVLRTRRCSLGGGGARARGH